MDRFSAYLLVRRHLKRSASRNQALAVEAIMEEIGRRRGEPAEQWGVLGLLSQLDLEYAEQNPQARGRTAREQAELEGLASPQGQHLERWCRHVRPDADPGELATVEQALLLATVLAEACLAKEEASDEAVPSLARELELMLGRGDRRGEELDRAIDALELTTSEAAVAAVNAMQRIAQDLR
jgi:predicted hydrolase (HD superfamily)